MDKQKQRAGITSDLASRALINEFGDESYRHTTLMITARWKLTCKLGRDMSQTSMTLEQINALIDWKMDRKENPMQDQITIEIRVDFLDKEKIQEVIKIMCSIAQTAVANINLLGPQCKPECVIFTDNFMAPPEKIDIYANLIGKGQEELDKIAGGASAEMLEALKG
jgi:hypothetical protein